jgi:hypothetical protein
MNLHRLVVLLVLSVCAAQAQSQPFHAWAEKPPMGWNSWDCFATTVTEAQTKANADVMAAQLKPHGWEYIVVDIQWYEPNANSFDYRKDAVLTLDAWGRLLPATNRFPSAMGGEGFKPLADYVHNLGLKFGIHLMRGIPRQAVAQNTPVKGTPYFARDIANTNSICPWNPDMFGVDLSKPGAQAYYDSVFELIASWGVDFVKVDDLSRPYAANRAEIEAIRQAIDRTGRRIVFSTSPGETPVNEGPHVMQHANMWRISDDFWDTWPALLEQFARLRNWTPYRGAGHWPDADMLPLGLLEMGKRHTRFTPDEQYTLMNLWCIARSPLMHGGDMRHMDDFTLSLLTNDEVIAVNQRSENNHELFNRDGLVAWVADIPDSTDRYLALFNIREANALDLDAALFRCSLVTRDTPGRSVSIDVDITGAQRLWLVVDDAGDGISADHANWSNPRLLSSTNSISLTEQRWVNATCGWRQPQINRSVSGAPMIVNGQRQAKGIGTHSMSVLEYTVPAGVTRFVAQGALDDAGAGQGRGASVKFLVFTNTPFSRSAATTVNVTAAELGFTGPMSVRDMWRQGSLGSYTNEFSAALRPHASGLYRVSGQRVNIPARAYLFTYFVGNGEDGLHLAWSRDGLKWEALNDGKSYLTPKVGESKLMRDPNVVRGPDGAFHLVWTTAWSGKTIGHASTKDFVQWTEQQAIPVMAHEPTVKNCWAPEAVWDAQREQFLIFWSSTIPGRFPETDAKADGGHNHRIYSTTTKDFQSFTPTRLFYEPGFNVIDATMIQSSEGHWRIIVKDETREPVAKKHLRHAMGDNPEGPFAELSAPFTRDWVEGPSAVRIGEDYLIYFDCYRDHHYGALRTSDWKTWQDVTPQLVMPKGVRHGTVIEVEGRIIERLLQTRTQ